METTCGGSSMITAREAMKQALEALESDLITHAGLVNRKQAIAVLRQALETERELTCVCGAVWEGEIMVHPPRKRGWVGLTDGEIDILSCETVKGNKSVNWLCKVLEAKLKEKNHG